MTHGHVCGDVYVSDAWNIAVTWDAASTMNGPIERYLIYVSTIDSAPGSVVYNSTRRHRLSYTVPDLTAVTHYFIRLAVSSDLRQGVVVVTCVCMFVS